MSAASRPICGRAEGSLGTGMEPPGAGAFVSGHGGGGGPVSEGEGDGDGDADSEGLTAAARAVFFSGEQPVATRAAAIARLVQHSTRALRPPPTRLIPPNAWLR